MTFAQKLVFLMNLTSTSNKQLSDAIAVDPSLISLMRTGRREPPRNNTHIRTMAAYFARKCEGNYQRIALSEAMGNKHLQLQMEVEQLSSVLADWLADDRGQVGRFLNTFERFSLEEPHIGHNDGPAQAPARSEPPSFAYYGNDGKRGAVGAFMERLLTVEEAGTVLLCSDESTEWLFEEPAFVSKMQEQLILLLKKGFRVCRIAAPLNTADQAFDSLSRWLPMYMTGQVESFYYPRLRDDMHRRTLIVMPGVGAVLSCSTAGQTVGRATIFTMDERLVNSFADEFQDILSKCRPMMTTYSTAVNSRALLRCISQFESCGGGDGRIQLSTSLSSITSPAELIRLLAKDAPKGEAADIIDTMAKAQGMFRQSLKEYKVLDIHSIATAQEVRSGMVPIAVAYLRRVPKLCYTPETYVEHLRSILEHIQTYDNYCAVLLPRSEGTHALMVKEGRQAILLRPGPPLMAFEVSQYNIAEACREYLLRLADTGLSPELQRQDAVMQINKLIGELERG